MDHHDKEQLYAAALDGPWVKSSFSAGSGNDCVQLMAIEGGIALGDSKRPDLAPLRYTRSELAAFIAAEGRGVRRAGPGLTAARSGPEELEEACCGHMPPRRW